MTRIAGKPAAGEPTSVQLTPDGSEGFNPAFDVTPARLVTALITERGGPGQRGGPAIPLRRLPLRSLLQRSLRRPALIPTCHHPFTGRA